jgi:hypothetical protein
VSTSSLLGPNAIAAGGEARNGSGSLPGSRGPGRRGRGWARRRRRSRLLGSGRAWSECSANVWDLEETLREVVSAFRLALGLLVLFSSLISSRLAQSTIYRLRDCEGVDCGWFCEGEGRRQEAADMRAIQAELWGCPPL